MRLIEAAGVAGLAADGRQAAEAALRPVEAKDMGVRTLVGAADEQVRRCLLYTSMAI